MWTNLWLTNENLLSLHSMNGIVCLYRNVQNKSQKYG